MSYINLKQEIDALAERLVGEFDPIQFSEGKEELLVLLDSSIHDYQSIDIHYEKNVRECILRQSRVDKKLDERIIKGKFIMGIALEEDDMPRFRSCCKLLIDLIGKQQNRRWGVKGIFYTVQSE